LKAIVFTEYGPPDVLQLKEVEKPTPNDNEVLIKVYASSVSSGDYEMRSSPFSTRFMALLFGFNFGLTSPKHTILGNEVAGKIEAIGKDVTQFNVGDLVYGHCGECYGANAEYVCLPEDAELVIKPDSLTFEEAASIPHGAHSALYFIRDQANVQPGQKVLIYGASGSVGSYAVQLAKYYGAEVTGVCSTRNLEMVKSLGADKVIDYTKEDFTQNGETYDVIYETVGKSSFEKNVGSLKEDGTYLAGRFGLPQIAKMGLASVRSDKKIVFGAAPGGKEDLAFITKLVEEEKIKPVVDRSYPLSETVEAHRYADTGHKRGGLIITVVPNGKTA
jgi:NADPH:quinone reductase-like Zn-dependent oxidoreductase